MEKTLLFKPEIEHKYPHQKNTMVLKSKPIPTTTQQTR